MSKQTLETPKKSLRDMDTVIDEMEKVFYGIDDGNTSIREANAKANVIGKILGASKIKMMIKVLDTKHSAINQTKVIEHE